MEAQSDNLIKLQMLKHGNDIWEDRESLPALSLEIVEALPKQRVTLAVAFLWFSSPTCVSMTELNSQQPTGL
jgi:hypothetical protein